MKRNLILLTAVVLAAVLLSGCILPFMGIKVTYDLPEDVFDETKLVEKVRKNKEAILELLFKEEDAEYEKGDFEVTVAAGETTIEEVTHELLKDEDGIEIVIENVGKKDIKVTVELTAEK